ncbi:hypothetical protein M9Y10_006467 [Tritrichomonas musculus]|uniref:N-acetyltransferase domain-containing protein n=1 Tax=Tritrichomonas musculus TaxID=1915356 RepID=A0ABR2JFA0_9EUKA
MISHLFSRSLSVRNATSGDCTFVREMISKINKIVYGSDVVPKNFNEVYNQMIQNPKKFPIFVAEEKDEKNKTVPLGAIVTSTMLYIQTCKPSLYIQDLVVDESARGKGVGSVLINHVIDYCKNNEMNYIDLVQPPDSDKFHEKRTKFYTEQGFEIGGRYRLMNLKP